MKGVAGGQMRKMTCESENDGSGRVYEKRRLWDRLCMISRSSQVSLPGQSLQIKEISSMESKWQKDMENISSNSNNKFGSYAED